MARRTRWRGRILDKAMLLGALGVWWFVLRPDEAVVNAVDTVSYLIAVGSVCRFARSLIIRMGPSTPKEPEIPKAAGRDRDCVHAADGPDRDCAHSADGPDSNCVHVADGPDRGAGERTPADEEEHVA